MPAATLTQPDLPERRALFGRYLRLLGLDRSAPSLEALGQLTRAHLGRVPFENVSKLYYRHDEGRRLPSLRQFLDGIERHHFGGTCYANNSHLNALLRHLGYQARLCGADMSRPDVHVVSLVDLEEGRYLVDGGYGAPFLDPIPLDLPHDHRIPSGRDLYVLRPRDAAGRSRMEHHRDGRLRHGYLVNPAPRRVEEFAGVVADSYAKDATFMNALMVARFFPDRSLILRNTTLTEADNGSTTWRSREVAPSDLPIVIEENFGIPRDLVRQALEGVELTQNA